MDISEEFVTKLIEEKDILSGLYNYHNEVNFNKIIENEKDIYTIQKLLKYKIILIYKRKTVHCSFDIEKLITRLSEHDTLYLHNILLYSLIIQPSVNVAIEYFNNSCNVLNNHLKDNTNILYHLEIIDVSLELFILIKNNLIKEVDILGDIIIHLISNDESNIRKKITTDIIPKYIICTENLKLFSHIWQEIKNTSLETYTLLALEKYFIPQNYTENNFNILNTDEFWIHLQKNICISDSALRKHSQYLLKKSIQILLNNESYIKNFIPKSEIFQLYDNFDEYKNAWKNFFILCETSNEKQLHLIEPTFKLYNSLKNLHFSWRICVTNLFIFHPHSVVVRLTIINILKREWYSNTNVLIQGLNNNFLYENSLSSEFMTYLNSYISTLTQKEYISFIKEICNSHMSPVPFYHICKMISMSNIKEINLKIIIDLITLKDKVPNLYIRKGISYSLFLCFTKTINKVKFDDENCIHDIIKIIYLFHSSNYLQRNNLAWKQLLKLLLANKTIFGNIAMKSINNYCLLPKEYSVFVVLLIDINILNICWIRNYLLYILTKCDDTIRLDHILFLFKVVNVFEVEDEIFEENIFFQQDFDNIFNELFSICNKLEIENYTVNFFDKIEFIFDMLFRIFSYKNNYKLYTTFLEKLEKENKFICYIILSKKVVQGYELNFNLNKINCKEELTNLLINLKNAKINCYIELKNTFDENNLKQRLFLNYYYSKLNIRKLLVKIAATTPIEESNNILLKISKCYDKGGLDIIISVIDTLNEIINHNYFHYVSPKFIFELLNLLKRCQYDIFNLRTNELFRAAIKKFILTILHPQIFQHDILKEYVNNFCLSMFDSSRITIGVPNEILCRIRIPNPEILVEGLLFGPILRKDQRIEFETCNIISQDIKKLNFDTINPWKLDGQVRSKSATILLSLINKPNQNFKVKQFCENVLLLLKEKYNKSAGKRYFGDSQIHLVKLRILQSFHLIIHKLNMETLNTTSDWLFSCLINESQQPSIKILIQWLLVRIYDLLKEKEKTINKLIYEVVNLKGTRCTSVFPLIYHLVKDRRINIDIVYDCMEFLLPYTMGQQFNIRFSAQITIKHIYEIYETEPDFSAKYKLFYKIVSDVIIQMSTDKNDDHLLTYYNFSPTIQTIYYDIPRLTNITQTEWLTVDNFNGIVGMKLHSKDGLTNIKTKIKTPLITFAENDNENMNVQKKIDPFPTKLMGDISEIRNSPGNLIVVACLVDKAPNLGGLSRTCEVFGVKQYVLNNIQLIKTKDFQSLSMSSDKWIDTLEVKSDNLSNYLLDMKKKNYKIIGAEQTSDSKKLNSFKFNSNTLLLLGNENEGIPSNLISLLDECIEIPQFGQIRSLNVHVAGALFIWEYAKQHCTTADY